MDNFKRIPGEKQKLIIDVAISTFAANGYRKSSINDIALSAGISKSMVFHYFGSKKALYLFLLEHCNHLLQEGISGRWRSDRTDFFERVKMATNIKLSLMAIYPSILLFLSSVYSEKAKEVETEVKDFISKNMVLSSQTALEGVDVTKFKPGIDPNLVFKLLMYLTEGYLSKIPVKNHSDINLLINELDKCIDLLKNNFYKEACL